MALSKPSQLLLDKIVSDYNERTQKKEKHPNKKDASAYIYNVFNGGYIYSGRQYKEIFNYLINL